MTSPRLGRLIGVSLALVALGTPSWTQRSTRSETTFIHGIYLGRERAEESKASLLVSDGRIQAILPADAAPPAGARRVDGEGALCLPSFLDAYTRHGVTAESPVVDQDVPVDVRSDVRIDMREANRKGVQPAFRSVEALALDDETTGAWRQAGFGAALVAPGGELFAGTSALVVARDAAARDLVVRPEVFAHGTFAATGRGYPSTLMGYTAQIRQFLHDANRHETLLRRHAQGRPGPRPPYDLELDAGRRLLSRELPLVVHANTARDLRRWFKLSDSFGFDLGVTGGREAWKVADELIDRRVPVVLTLDWGKEVDDPDAKKKKDKGKDKDKTKGEDSPKKEQEEQPDKVEAKEAAAHKEASPPAEIAWTYDEPLAVRREKRRLWEQGRDCALRLKEKGVRFAFGTDGAKPDKLMKSVRALIEAGLDANAALQGLTTDAAELLGVDGRLGRVAPGYDATFTLWTEDPLTDKKAQVAWAFVDGRPTEYEVERKKTKGGEDKGPDEGVDASGTWLLTVESDQGSNEAKLVLEMDDDGEVTGTYHAKNPMDDSDMQADCKGRVSGKVLTLEVTLEFGDFTISTTMQATVAGTDLADGEATYDMPWSDDPVVRAFEGAREPEYWDLETDRDHLCEEDHPHEQ